jgi:hypothetical protein
VNHKHKEKKIMSEYKEPSGWAIGWTAFAGITMLMAGGWWMISGLVALFNSEFFVVTQNYIFKFDWARTVGVIIAVFMGLASFAWLPYYPVWAVVYIVASVAIIWALTVHGRDITT